ncbi:peptidoglycan editing factor PgeF [Niveibacterium sp. SC-1]|uniref:peptidoglycan editing factor PgeF n=1 Tax=Niveibacterium sp. SC-1 TaxID=3135646 RepID=UPI00311D5AFC
MTSPGILPCIVPDWSAPPRVRAFFSTRDGGVSLPPFASLNLGDHVGDRPEDVRENRRRVEALLPAGPRWLQQVHGTTVVSARGAVGCEADAAVAHAAGEVCVVMVADCLPVLFCDRAGTVVGAAHAGWRGLAGGVLEACVRKMGVAPAEVLAWLGPAIGPSAFEIGPEVRETFMADHAEAAGAFRPGRGDRWMADIYMLARLRLERAGMDAGAIYGGTYCTASDPARFFSYRRDGRTGRMGAFVWLDGASVAAIA